jgi:enterochelin esterase-like enzyme
MKTIFLVIAVMFLSLSIQSQTGKVLDNLSLPSKILNMDRKFAIYLPPDYETSQRSYPVLYLLQFGEVLHIADEAINSGKATPMIIVMPDANTGQRGYFNDIRGKWRYEDFFFQELIPFIEKQYRVKTDKQYRAISGLSMGGGGTFVYALHHPEMFSSACPLSASVGALTPEDARARMKDLTGVTDQDFEAYYNKYSVLRLIDSIPDDQKKAVRWYIDCGDDDFLYEGNCLAHIAMRKKEIPHEFRTRDGGHTWTYWRASLPEVLSFISDAFHQY